MQLQQPPQKPITITQSSHSNTNTENKTLRTTLQLYQDHENLKKLALQLNELKKNIETLKENLEIHENSTDDEFVKFDKYILKLEDSVSLQETSSGIQAMTIMDIQDDIAELKKDISLLKEQTKSSLNTIEKLEKDQHITSNFLTFAETNISYLNETVLKLATEIANVAKKINDTESLKQQAVLLLTQEVSELKNSQSSPNKPLEEISSIQKELLLFKEQLKEQQLLLESTNQKNTSLENIITQQTQSIFTLRKWFMALGISGGSVIALTIWLWHYTHK